MRTLKQEYQKLAPCYDARWHTYIDRSINETLARLRFNAGESLVDIGCGTGELLRRVHVSSPSSSLVGLEPSAQMLAQAQTKLAKRVAFVQASAGQLPFLDATFDCAVCTSVLHYLPEPIRAIAEIKRVLKPGGRLILTDWCNDYRTYRIIGGLLKLFKRPLAHIYSTAECRNLLEHAGLHVDRLERYKINWKWGLMTASATAPEG